MMKLQLAQLYFAALCCVCVVRGGVYQNFRLTSSLDDLMWEEFMDNIGSKVNKIAIDEFVPGNILYSSGAALWTTDGQTKSLICGGKQSQSEYIEEIGGEAVFKNDIFGFYQLDSTQVVVADIFNHCYRMVDRNSNQTSSYIGACTVKGNQDGVMSELSLPSPDIHKDFSDPTTLLFTDQNLRGQHTEFKQFDAYVTPMMYFMNLTGATSTFYTTPTQSIEGGGLVFTQDPETNDIYFDPTFSSSPTPGSCSIAHYSFQTQTITCTSTEPYALIWNLQGFRLPSGKHLLFLNNGVPTIYAIDAKVSTPLCVPGQAWSISICSEGPFTSILLEGDTLILGSGSKILRAKVSGCGCFKNRKTFSPYMTDRCASYDEEENYSFTVNPYSGSGLQTCPPNTIFNYEVCDCQLDWFVDCPLTCLW